MFELKSITYATSGQTLLQDVNLHLAAGSRTAIMGLNGAGKTTLLKILSRALIPSSGNITVSGKNLKDLSSKDLARQIAYVAQDFPTDFPFTVLDFILMGRFAWQKGYFPSAEDQRIAKEQLARFQLDGFEQRWIQTLSGGERQRLLVARALVQTTPRILLDEPLNHLDIKHKTFILKTLCEENQKNGKTLIAVMHDFMDVLNYFTDVVLLKNGRVLFNGPVEEAFQPERLHEVFEMDLDFMQTSLKNS